MRKFLTQFSSKLRSHKTNTILCILLYTGRALLYSNFRTVKLPINVSNLIHNNQHIKKKIIVNSLIYICLFFLHHRFRSLSFYFIYIFPIFSICSFILYHTIYQLFLYLIYLLHRAPTTTITFFDNLFTCSLSSLI